MGCGGSKTAEEVAASRMDAEIAKAAAADAEAENQKIKLLLLGSGESGKSTIFKQMKILYGMGFRDEDRKQQLPVIMQNTIGQMKVLLQACEDMEIAVAAEESAGFVQDMDEEEPITEEVAEHIETLWADPGIQEAYGKRASFQLNDSAEYFFKKVKQQADPTYVPSVKDILQMRVRTSGIVQEEYIIDGAKFVMYDVGGQRNERKKWIHCFDEVTAVIFVAAISEYDQVLYEDATTNRMKESLQLFHEICNSKWFEHTDIILFLNKKDLFEEKIARVDIRQPDPKDPSRMIFDEYEGGCDYDAGSTFIMQEYLKQNECEEGSKEIYVHITCATDTNNVSTVFNAAKESILKKNLQGSGFME